MRAKEGRVVYGIVDVPSGMKLEPWWTALWDWT